MLILKPPILFLCWEFEGFNNPQTTALVRRPRYFAEALVNEGYEVTVVFSAKEEIDRTETKENGGKLRLISVPEVKQALSANPFINKLYTFFSILRFGDFSGEWYEHVEQKLIETKIDFQIVVAFFTPRGPLYTAYKLKAKYDFKLIMDFQDPYYEGLDSRLSRDILKKSFRRVVKSADAISCVNRSWGEEIVKDFDAKANYIPHVIENRVDWLPEKNSRDPNRIVFFYSGSIDLELQSPLLFFECLQALIQSGLYQVIEFRYAGNPVSANFFKDKLPTGIEYNYLGWLGRNELYNEIVSADIVCVFPVVERGYKKFVPSKFYEFCRFSRPILIIGNDTGAFRSEFGEVFDREFVIRDKQKFMGMLGDYKAGRTDQLFSPQDEFLHVHSIEHAYKLFKKELGC